MKHIFISHAGADTIEKKLCGDLKGVAHDVNIDLYKMGFGDSTIKFINDAITNAHTVMIIFSRAHGKRQLAAD